jgi:hypothetical protein
MSIEFNSPLGRLAFAEEHALNGNNPKIIGISDETNPVKPKVIEKIKESEMDVYSTDKEEWDQIAKLVDDQEALREKVESLRAKNKESLLKINDKNREKVEVLLSLKRKTKDVEIGEMVFRISTLKRKQSKELSLALLDKRKTSPNDLDLTFELMNETLARVIVEVSDLDTTLGKFVSFKDFLGVEDEKDIVLFIEELDEDVVDLLYSEYLNLKKDVSFETSEKTVEEIKKL